MNIDATTSRTNTPPIRCPETTYDVPQTTILLTLHHGTVGVRLSTIGTVAATNIKRIPQPTILNRATTIRVVLPTPLTAQTALVLHIITQCPAPIVHASTAQRPHPGMRAVSGYHEMRLANGVNRGPQNQKNLVWILRQVWVTEHGQHPRAGLEKTARVRMPPAYMIPVIPPHIVPIFPKQKYTTDRPIMSVQTGVIPMITTTGAADVTKMAAPAAWEKGGVSAKFVVTGTMVIGSLNEETRIHRLSDVPCPSQDLQLDLAIEHAVHLAPVLALVLYHRALQTPARGLAHGLQAGDERVPTDPEVAVPIDGIIGTKNAKTNVEGMIMSQPTSEFEENDRDSDESEKRRTEALKRPVHRLPESSHSKVLETSPAGPQRLNGFNQQKPRPPLSPASFRAPNAMSRALAPETELPTVEISAALTNGLHLSTGTIPTGPRSMTQVSQPQISNHPEPAIVPTSKPLTTSPITLKVQPSKAPSKTVKMFFPGDDDDEDTPTRTESGFKSTNLIPPVKDRDSPVSSAQGAPKSEFVAAMAPSAPRAPPTAPAAHISPQRRTNGAVTPAVSISPKAAITPAQQAPVAPRLARVIRDEAPKTTASTPPGFMPPPSAPGSSPTVAANSGGATTPTQTLTQRSPAFVPENKVLRAVASSGSTPRRPPKVPKTASEYQIICQVGEGTFGKVYKARSLANPEARVALKRIRMEGEKDGFPVTAMREIKLLQSLRHENVINLHEMMVSKGNVFMVFEYMDHDLTGVLSQTQFTFTPAHLKSLCAQMLSGLAYLHQKSVIHRDMKGSNILLNNYGELKLGDFGLARFYSKRRRSDYTNRVITLWYRPPELLLGATVYGPEVDMWSAGCIMLELFTTKPAFQGNDEIHQLDAIARVMGTPSIETWPGLTDMPWFELVKPAEPVKSHFRSIFNKYLSPAALDLAESLLAYDPNKRATAAQALQASYFVSEGPPPEKPVGLATIEGEWHEYESKREREKLRKKRKVEGQQPQ
ncbi:unnamed protein product [Rhizoctonia solani]|uniref:Protein kinase domain-containing protein n=1 Tax=Rhizoctonia solani TaxID=456999 RepID=A0A8H3CK78_9AGAM|nr:unnamed protein product [Rhizoctonia solani]